MSDLTPEEAKVTAWLASRKEAMVALLREMVDTDSGSYDKAGVDRAGQVLARFHEANGLSVEIVPDARYGDAVKARLPNPSANDQRPVLLLGHRDTVFPQGEPTRRPFTIKGGRAYGPGVADMKAGLVIEAFVAAAFAECGGLSAPLLMLTTSDEEIASPSSRPIIEAAAREARCVFNAEPSRLPAGTEFSRDQKQSITSGRKGGVFMRAEFTGKAAHSGANYDKGVSAIVDLGHKIPRLQGLTDLERGVTVNVGLIGGGQTVNTIAPHAWCEIDLRYVTAAQRDELVGAIRTIVETPVVPGATGALTVKGEFVPLERSPESAVLFETYRDAAAGFGISVAAEFTGGCADSGFTAAQGCPTLCSVGPIGGLAHTPDEFLEVESIVPAAQVLALAVMRTAARME
ncbi:M20 family metallopeptidase [Bosea psychrotolerans]|uniref:Glutamate carboxypeptidase n=1 Tax=Bosea psychrotolerans TaxID=1871628 RepID=A0A2S4MG47_9HYPH|nr:M20 family metallopeptidase [Bosea psychrotolerans]POR53407.1 glutamate carboxypeptidase [Bosea psychrotolerans]